MLYLFLNRQVKPADSVDSDISHKTYDIHGHVAHHHALEMTNDQAVAYKKTAAATLGFLNQFRHNHENYADFLMRLKNYLVFPYEHPYRTREFCNAFALCREDYVGIKLMNMSPSQLDAFYGLMQTVLAPYGYEKMEKVFGRQLVLHDIEEAAWNDPEKYPILGGPPGTSLEHWRPVDKDGRPLLRDPKDYYIAFFGDLEQFMNGDLSRKKRLWHSR